MTVYGEFLFDLGRGDDSSGEESLHRNKQKRLMAMQLRRHCAWRRRFWRYREFDDFVAF
jgi:hypothetical protein